MRIQSHYRKTMTLFTAFFLAFFVAYCPSVFAEDSTTKLAPATSALASKVTPSEKNDDADSEEATHEESASSAEDHVKTDTSNDPLEPFNRAMFTFNDKLDKYLLKPIATAYNTIMPKPLNQGVHNFFTNLNTITVIANDVLQFNFFQAANDMWRLGVNTTVGIGGIFDIATRIKLKAYHNDFGMTLARWGYKNSTYLVLPFFGPNTIRDGLGIPVDYFAFSVYPYIQPESTRYQVYGLGVVDRRAQLLKYEEVVDEASVDRYVFVRDAYKQHRAEQIEDNDHRSYLDTKQDESQVVTASASDTTDVTVEAPKSSVTDTLASPAPIAKAPEGGSPTETPKTVAASDAKIKAAETHHS